MPTRLGNHNISAAEAAEKVRARFAERKTVLGEHLDIDSAAAAEIILRRA